MSAHLPSSRLAAEPLFSTTTTCRRNPPQEPTRPRRFTQSLSLEVAQSHTSGSREASSAHGSRSENDVVPNPQRVLVVDDERLIADTLVRILNMNGFEANAAYCGDSALEAAKEFCPAIVITDVRMPGRSGIDVGIALRSSCPQTRVVLLSGQASVSEIVEQAREAGHSFELWPKPIHPRELVQRLRST